MPFGRERMHAPPFKTAASPPTTMNWDLLSASVRNNASSLFSGIQSANRQNIANALVQKLKAFGRSE